MVAITKEIRLKLRAIYTVLLIFEKFSLPKIRTFLNEHEIWLQKAPISPEMQVLVDRTLPVFGPLEAAILVKEIDVSGGSADVVSFDELKATLPVRIDRIKTMVKNLMPNNKPILVLLNLDHVNFYYQGKQAELIDRYTNLVTKITATAALSTVIPVATALKNEISNAYSTKHSKFDDIKKDRTNMMPLLLNAKFMLIRNFGMLNDMCWENLEEVTNYFPISDFEVETHSETFLLINQYLVSGTQGETISLIEVDFENDNFCEVDCRKCPVGLNLFLASEITGIIPKNAQRVNKGERIIFKLDTVGSTTEKYMIAVLDTDESVDGYCDFYIQIDKKKPQRKNIYNPLGAPPVPVVVVPAPAILVPEPVVVAPEPIVEPPKIVEEN